MKKKIFTTLGAVFLALILSSTQAQTKQIYGSVDDPLVAEVLDTEIHSRDAEEMKYVILSKLIDRYASDQGIAVEAAEIDAYIRNITRALQKDRRQKQARRDELNRQLSSSSLSDSERQSIEQELATLNELLDNLSDPANDSAEDKAARREIAAAFIRQWKINEALYHQYGGRIIYQQGGAEPLDAYHQFLQEQAQAGAFKILDKDFESEFRKYYSTDSLHSFYPAGSEEESLAFEVPPWLMIERPPTWYVVSLNGQAVTGDPEILFSPAGSISGSTGCNRFRANGKVDAGALIIDGPVAVTRMMCPGEALTAQDDTIIKFLQGRIDLTYNPFNGEMVLSNAIATLLLFADR